MISNSLKKIRNNMGYNKRQMATFLEMPYTTYNNYETGEREPSIEVIKTLSEKLKVSVGYLLGTEEIDTIQRIDMVTSKASLLLEKMKANLQEEQIKEEICNIVKLLDVYTALKVYDYVIFEYEKMTYNDKDQISLFDDDKKESQEDDSE